MPSNWTEIAERLTLETNEVYTCLVFRYWVNDNLVPATLLYGRPNFNGEEHFHGMIDKSTAEVAILKGDLIMERNDGGDYSKRSIRKFRLGSE